MRWTHLFAGVVAFVLLTPAFASAGPPAQVPFQGYVTDGDGVPLDEETTIVAEIYDRQSGGTALHSEQLTVNPNAGSFTAHLGEFEALDLSIFRENENLWVELTVDGEVLEPRLKIGTAPYAASAGFADEAATVGGKTASELETPDWDDIENKPADAGKSYTAGDGMNLDSGEFSVDPTQVQNRVDGTCGSGEYATGVNQDGTLMCSKPPVAQAGDGLTKNGDTMSVDSASVQSRVTGTCNSGQKIIGINQDGSVQCGTDATGGDIDGVSAGDGLSGGGTSGNVTLNVASGGIDGSHLSNNLESSDIEFSGSGSSRNFDIPSRAVDTTEISQDAVTTTELASDAVTSDELASNAVSTSELASGAVTTNELASGAVTNTEMSSDSVTTTEIQDGTIDGQDIGEYPCDQGSSNTSFVKISNCENMFDSPTSLPDCDEVANGGVCESDFDNCTNTDSGSDHCTNSIYEVYVRSSW